MALSNSATSPFKNTLHSQLSHLPSWQAAAAAMQSCLHGHTGSHIYTTHTSDCRNSCPTGCKYLGDLAGRSVNVTAVITLTMSHWDTSGVPVPLSGTPYRCQKAKPHCYWPPSCSLQPTVSRLSLTLKMCLAKTAPTPNSCMQPGKQ